MAKCWFALDKGANFKYVIMPLQSDKLEADNRTMTS